MQADYPPIADYGLIGDCHASALVSRDGSIDWCCLPRPDDASCFGRLLDRSRGGFCAVELDEPAVAPAAHAYEDGTLVLTDGLLCRYRRDDGLGGEEATFVPCAFWLARCLAEQGRPAEARSVFDRAVGAASPLGLFSEQYDPGAGEMLGNFPQALTHLSHIEAALTLQRCCSSHSLGGPIVDADGPSRAM